VVDTGQTWTMGRFSPGPGPVLERTPTRAQKFLARSSNCVEPGLVDLVGSRSESMNLPACPRVALETLGCKLNQYETEAVAAGFRLLGWEIVSSHTMAEAYVINTCTVTNKADRKSRNVLGRFLGQLPAPIVVVTGCFAESARETLESLDGITFVIPNQRKNQIAALVDSHYRGEIGTRNLPLANSFAFPVLEKVFHTRASVKIQDGCDHFCSFCIIPSVRGQARSRPMEEVLETARVLIASGRKELVLTGVNMGQWREDGRNFISLVKALLDLDGDFRLRITSMEPEGLGQDFASLFSHPKMCPHLHLCLQSGSPRILLAMRRQYTLDQFAALVSLLRGQNPGLNLTTDLIVGFPGETTDDFEQSLESVEAFGFSFVHLFPFSPRQDTRAERMPGQIADIVKQARLETVRAAAAGARERLMTTLVGQFRRVLVETSDGKTPSRTLRGFTEDYFPVRFEGTAPWNSFVEVQLVRVVKAGDEFVFDGKVSPF